MWPIQGQIKCKESKECPDQFVCCCWREGGGERSDTGRLPGDRVCLVAVSSFVLAWLGLTWLESASVSAGSKHQYLTLSSPCKTVNSWALGLILTSLVWKGVIESDLVLCFRENVEIIVQEENWGMQCHWCHWLQRPGIKWKRKGIYRIHNPARPASHHQFVLIPQQSINRWYYKEGGMVLIK